MNHIFNTEFFIYLFIYFSDISCNLNHTCDGRIRCPFYFENYSMVARTFYGISERNKFYFPNGIYQNHKVYVVQTNAIFYGMQYQYWSLWTNVLISPVLFFLIVKCKVFLETLIFVDSVYRMYSNCKNLKYKEVVIL